jgi:outer membrane biosynthesis protein TonB
MRAHLLVEVNAPDTLVLGEPIVRTPLKPASPATNQDREKTNTDMPLGFSDPRHYYQSSELDERPKALAGIEPDDVMPNDDTYIVLRLLINERGDVDEVEPVISDASEAEKSAVAAFKAARFSPGMRRGAPVKSEMWVELKFYANTTPGAPRPDEPY